MVATQWDEKLIEQLAKEFEPDVVRVRVNYGEDWHGEPMAFFHIILADQAAKERLRAIAQKVERRFSEGLAVWESPYFPLFRFRSQSEQDAMKDPQWA